MSDKTRVRFFFWKVWPRLGFGRFGQARGPVVSWSLVPWSRGLWSSGPAVLWSPGPLVPRSFGPVVLRSRGPVVLRSRGPLVLCNRCATILAQSRSILRESTFRVFVLYIRQSRCGDKGSTVYGVNAEDPKAQKLQCTPHMNPLRTRQNDVVFANGGGGGLRPPNPPAVFLSRAGLLSRTSHPEQDVHQTRNCFRAFQNSS